MINFKDVSLKTYPIALIVSAASIYLFTQPNYYPSIHLGPVFAYLIALIIQLIWLIVMFSFRQWKCLKIGVVFVTINLIGVLCSAVGVAFYYFNGEVYGINIDLILGPLIAVVVAVILLVALAVEGVKRRLGA